MMLAGRPRDRRDVFCIRRWPPRGRLELCLSDDRQFCAVQLLRFGDFQYKPVFEPRFYEGKDAEAVAQLL